MKWFNHDELTTYSLQLKKITFRGNFGKGTIFMND